MKINVTAEIVKVTPELASEWLADKWKDQRGLRSKHVSRLVADMIAGRFKISPDAILRLRGQLANGQHRLSAVVQSGKAQLFVVMESNDEELYKVIDAGLKRTVSDGLYGVMFSQKVPSIARWVQGYHLGINGTGDMSTSHSDKRRDSTLTQIEQIEYCQSHATLLSEAASFVTPLYSQTKLLPVSISGALYVIASEQHLEQVKEFLVNLYVEGGPNAAGDLRNRLISNQGSKTKLPVGYVFGISLKALRAFLNGSRPGVLKWVKGEALPVL